MKSKQSLFEQIISTSIRKAREQVPSALRESFEQSLKQLPPKIKSLDADPYMFVFDSLIQHPHQVDFVLTQYKNMLSENFLNPQHHSTMLVSHFRANLAQHSFRIVQIIIDIREPNLQFLELFFQIHNSIAMADNVLEAYKYTGYRWLARAFCFRQHLRPKHIDDMTSGILRAEDRNLPTEGDELRAISKYVEKVLLQVVLNVDNNLREGEGSSTDTNPSSNIKVQSKYGFCFMCLKPADFYCKDTGVPVCGSDCKKSHLNLIANNPVLDHQYPAALRVSLQSLLVQNLRLRRNIALSIDYLCAIYLNSSYAPQHSLPHREVLPSPVIVERIWLLYNAYYWRSGQVCEHVFADLLSCGVGFVSGGSREYFLRVADNAQKLFEMYECLDWRGYRRVLPIVMAGLADEQNKMKFIQSLVNTVYTHMTTMRPALSKDNCDRLQEQSVRLYSMIRVLNHEKNPVRYFTEMYGSQGTGELIKFVVKNEQMVNRNKLCDVILSDDDLCRQFLRQLFLQPVQGDPNAQAKFRLKFSPYIDEILRETFYFINIKIADKIYHLLELLCEVLDFKHLEASSEGYWASQEPQVVFAPDNTSSENTFFQFAYYIIMVVTELHQLPQEKEKGKISEAEFLARVRSFDAKFATNMKQYITGVYCRLVEQPFCQQTRGILSKYAHAPKPAPSETPFLPVRMLLQNWQCMYQCLSAQPETTTLYRICSCLTRFPRICEQFFTLLLSKLGTPLNNEQHLLPSINAIMQEQPNCIGASSWKYMFLKQSETNLLMFELSMLVHYARVLTLPNFIWFVRQFCRNVRLGQHMGECAKLLQHNFVTVGTVGITEDSPDESHSLSGTTGSNNIKQRQQILNKQYIQLFLNEPNTYHRIQFLRQVFALGNYELAVHLLDIVEVNMVSENLIITMLMDVLPLLADRHSTLMQHQPQQWDRMWQHMINKVLIIGVGSSQLFLAFSAALRSIPSLTPHFETLNIQYAIQAGGECPVLDPGLTRHLHKFQEHIPQMAGRPGLLAMFVHADNLDCIVRQFRYFWDIEQVYQLLAGAVIEDGKREASVAENKQSEGERSEDKGSKSDGKDNSMLSVVDLQSILCVMQQNSVFDIMKSELALQPVAKFITAAYCYLHGSPPSEPKQPAQQGYRLALLKIVNQCIMPMLPSITTHTHTHYLWLNNVIYFYLHTLTIMSPRCARLPAEVLMVGDIARLLNTVNNDIEGMVRMRLSGGGESGWATYHVHECLAYGRAIFHSGQISNEGSRVLNWGLLIEYLESNMGTCRRLFSEASRPKKPSTRASTKQPRPEPSTRPSTSTPQGSTISTASQPHPQNSPNVDTQQQLQLQLLNTKIVTIRKVLELVHRQVTDGQHSVTGTDRHRLTGVLVQYMNLGFDCYDTRTRGMGFGDGRDRLAYLLCCWVNKGQIQAV